MSDKKEGKMQSLYVPPRHLFRLNVIMHTNTHSC